LWLLLAALVLAMLAIMVYLAGRYEASQVQGRLERDTSDAVSDIRSGLSRNLQSLQALQAGNPAPKSWRLDAADLLRAHREMLRIEWRDVNLGILAVAETPFREGLYAQTGRESAQSDVNLACATARRFNGPAYSTSYFVPRLDGQGLEVIELCLPQISASHLGGYLIATYSLQDILSNLVNHQLARSQEISFTEADGTRLALYGSARRGTRLFTAHQLVDLPGNTLVLRMDGWHGAPSLFPNVMTALVTVLSIALVSVLVMLAKDTRRRLAVEHDLAEALAFRKAMEDSLVTGLRARDLQGRITYVNPAFCQMVGFSAEELLGHGVPAPYWPADLVTEYQQRQAIRLAGNMPPREGFESVFMRKDGSRFPVLVIEAPLINALGVQTGWMSAFLDMSEQRRMEELSRASHERLQATARLATVGEMASMLSHELNQPLAAISSYATGSLNLLQRSEGPAPMDLDMALRRIAEQAERAGRVIKSVHDFVRRRDQARESVSARQLLDAILPLVTLQARKLGVRVLIEIEPGLPDVQCDRTMVEQVLLNLARNAVQAMERTDIARRLLLIRAGRAIEQEPGGWLELSVSDSGPGISQEVASQLFTPFFTTKAEGMGLGLSLCRTVVEQHGGYLGFEARQPEGTIFRFTLPVKKTPAD
jgi:two-component system sensor histidine kinase DctS